MQKNPLIPIIKSTLAQEDLALPIFNKIALELQKVMRERDYDLADITKVILKDPGLSSDVLKMANSSFYAGVNPAKTVQDATVRLGAKTIFNLVTAVTQKELYRSKKKRFERWMKPLWSHSLGVAFASRWIALQGGMRQLSEESFMAGLLHDTGKLVILRAIEDHASDLPEDLPGMLIDQTLEQIHPALGEQLMRRMNLPEIYCRVAALHHHPDGGKDKDILSVVRLVNLACRKSGIGLKKDPEIELAASSEAAALELDGEVLDELQLKLVQYMDVLKRL